MHFAKIIPSPIGNLYIVADENSLIALDGHVNERFNLAQKVETHKVLDLTQKQLNEYFNGTRKQFSIPLNPNGSEFQKIVWNALLKIPYGKVWSYGQQAKFINNPKAFRAVGGANGKNPIAIIIPCHRVIGSNGNLTGFSSGMSMKIALLELEGHQIQGEKIQSFSVN